MQNLAPAYDEELLSQIPALKQLINLGYIYLSPKEALAERYNKNSNILLERILAEQLKKLIASIIEVKNIFLVKRIFRQRFRNLKTLNTMDF